MSLPWHALDALPPAQRALLEPLLRLVEQGRLTEATFREAWATLTGRPLPAASPDAGPVPPGHVHPDTSCVRLDSPGAGGREGLRSDVPYVGSPMGNLVLSEVRRDLTDIVALLSQAEEPLDVAGLALLLSGDPDHVDAHRPRVQAALRLGATLFRQAPMPDAADAWVLCHQSFREHVDRTPAMKGSVKVARRRLVDAAAHWPGQAAPALAPLRAHLFRRGTAYALAWSGDAGAAAVRSRLTDFAYLQARTAALPAAECADLAQEYKALSAASTSVDPELGHWANFMAAHMHLLCRGDATWPANRILLQLAVEHASDSPVVRAAEAWLKRGA